MSSDTTNDNKPDGTASSVVTPTITENTVIPEQPVIEESVPVIDDLDEPAEITDTATTDTKKDTSTEEPVETTGRKNQSVVQDKPIDINQEPTTNDVYILASNHDKETREKLQDLPNIDIIDNETSRAWADTLSEGLSTTTFNEVFVNTLENKDADFRQSVVVDNIDLAGGYPALKQISNESLKGERAVVRTLTFLGIGSLYQVPLWHSGIWVTFKPPTETDLIELNRILVSDKIKFGRYSYGLAYSNILSFTVDRLVDFAIAHVYDITAKSDSITIENLKDHILSQDIYVLLWGLMCSVYPKGFKYRRACINSPDKCNNITQGLLNLSKLQWTNTNALTPWQKTFMSGRQSKSKDADSINRYREELFTINKRKVVINEGQSNEFYFILKSPTISEYVNAGYRWISDIVEQVDKSLGLNNNDEERNNFIKRHGQATMMRQYMHWIESIHIDENFIDDYETIEKNINVLSSNDDIRNQFISGVVKYINDSTISIIGIPVYDCPVCSGSQEVEHHYPAHKNIIPLDVIQLFFALLGNKLNNLIER